MQPSLAETLSRLPLTRTLAATIARAHDYATQQSHRFVTLEHLLLALAEDAEAAVVLQASSIDLVGLATEVAAHVGRIDDRVAAGQPVLPNINADVIRILEYSAAATRQSRRGREISGAVVLAAIVGDGKSAAAHLLRAYGLTFESAIKALQRSQAASSQRAPQPTMPTPPVPLAPMAPPPVEQPQALPSVAVPAAALGPAAVPTPPPSAPELEPAPAPTPNSTEDILASVRRRIGATRPASASPLASAPAPPMDSPAAPTFAPPPDVRLDSAPVQMAAPHLAPPLPDLPAPLAVPEAEAEIPVEPWTPATSRSGAASAHGPPPLPSGPVARLPADQATSDLAQRLEDLRRPTQQRPVPRRQALPTANAIPARPADAIVPWPEMASAPAEIIPELEYAYDGDPAGAPYPTPDDGPARQAGAQSAYWGRASLPRPSLDMDVLAAALPHQMRIGRRSACEVRIERADLATFAPFGVARSAEPDRLVGQALSLRLCAPAGGLYVEPTSPETLWIDGTRPTGLDDDRNWSWTITPHQRGRQLLQLTASVRTIGADGIVAETAFPDRTIEVQVAADMPKRVLRVAGWGLAILAGAALAKFGTPLATGLASILSRSLGV